MDSSLFMSKSRFSRCFQKISTKLHIFAKTRNFCKISFFFFFQLKQFVIEGGKVEIIQNCFMNCNFVKMLHSLYVATEKMQCVCMIKNHFLENLRFYDKLTFMGIKGDIYGGPELT